MLLKAIRPKSTLSREIRPNLKLATTERKKKNWRNAVPSASEQNRPKLTEIDRNRPRQKCYTIYKKNAKFQDQNDVLSTKLMNGSWPAGFSASVKFDR